LFFGQRLGWVIGLALIVSRIPANSRALGWLLLAGRESLFVYVVHLFLIYAVPWWGGSTPDRGIGPTQSPLHVLLLFIGLLSVSLALAFANERRKARARGVV
jgi:surface polysaccharide O-acyltransferase-like enzyme